MKRKQFLFCLGYQGTSALVDKRNMHRYGKLSSQSLTDLGLYKAALSAAIYDQDDSATRYLLEKYQQNGPQYTGENDLKRLFGVFGLPDKINEIIYI